MELKTPLYDCHVKCAGKIVPFANYLLPVQYEGVIAEHMAVRQKAGLFDVSHMGEVLFTGKDALANIQMLLSNNYDNMEIGQARYSPMCNENGGVVDDLIVYRLGEEKYLIVVNAANRHKDVAWMKAHIFGNVEMQDVSDSVAQLALQGPRAIEILKALTDEKYIPEKYYTAIEKAVVAGTECMVSRTGYTGEDGVEIYCKNDDAVFLWEKILEAGKDFGLVPCGLGARDTLRLEASMPLYGHEMTDDISPKESGLGMFVKMDKPDFIGKKAIEDKGPLTRRRVGLKILDRGIAREECKIYKDGAEIGWVTSGTHCPFLGCAVAMAMLDVAFKEPGTIVEVDVRGRKLKAEVIKTPFYKKNY